MSAQSPVKSKMGVIQLTILTMVNMMGSGIIMLPTKLAEVGTISITSWLVTAVGSVSLAYAFSKCGMFSRKPGGMGGYAEYAFGKSGNFMVNYTYSISLLIANIAIAVAAVGYAAEFFNIRISPMETALSTIALLWLAVVFNFGGPRITGQISTVTVWGLIIPVLGVSVIGWFWFNPNTYAQAWNPHDLPIPSAITASISMTLWAFLGLESACANAEAAKNPERDVPIAVLVGTTGVATIYIASTNIMAGIVSNADLVKSTAPFGLVFAYMFNPFLGKLITALMIIGCCGCLLGWQFTVSQVFKSSSEVGYFPKIFSKITKAGAPIKGMCILASIQTALALMTISPTLTRQFNDLVNLAVVINIVPYLLSMAALFIIQKTAKVDAKKAFLGNFIALIGSIYSFYALYSTGREAMFWGALVTFLGWTLYGFIAHRFEKIQS